MRRYYLALLIIILIACTPLLPALAQSEVKLSSMEVDLWPEYDRPNVLVIYRITLPPTTTLPVDLSFRIPAAAGEPSAVAVRQMSAQGEAGLSVERVFGWPWATIHPDDHFAPVFPRTDRV